MTGHDGWDWWSEVKLQILRDYLQGFTRVVRGGSEEATYLDLFAGSYENHRRHEPGTFPGSSQIALDMEPPFTRLVFCELEAQAQQLRQDIESARAGDTRWRVVEGDCNTTLPSILDSLSRVRWAPTFAFLDPKGLQVAWGTVETLAKWRADKKTKVEQWILFPEPALSRVLGLRGARGRSSADRLDRLFGTNQWIAIHQLRRSNQITPEVMRAEFVNLLRWRLEQDLGYCSTHALQIVNTTRVPVYTLVFATDSPPGDAIMSHLYGSASTRTIPAMRARAQATRERSRLEQLGAFQLPGFDTVQPTQGVGDAYTHTPPWRPPPLIDDHLDLEGEPDIDPDEIDLDGWGDEEPTNAD